jgi:hypothetical protein
MRHGRALVVAYCALWASAAAAGLAVHALPGAAAAVRGALALPLNGGGPHALGTAAVLALHNACVALWPRALAATGVARFARTRRGFDVVVGASLAANGASVGAALGAYGAGLVPYLVQLPVEWLALAVGAAGWFGVREGGGVGKGRLASLAALLVVAAALIEVFATPRG